MKDALTILVVGAGRFAANYMKVLAALGRRMPADLPPIGTVVVTRTSPAAAKETAAAWQRSPATGFSVLADAVDCDSQLASVLARHQPQLTCITARDPDVGDDIHARYAALALETGAVLMEKNCAGALGDGASLALVETLARHPKVRHLGMALPMAPLRAAMAARSPIDRALSEAQEIRFHWETPHVGAMGLVQELALHPWSLLPAETAVSVAQVAQSADGADIRLALAPTDSSCAASCHIRLQIGARRRTMDIGDLGLGFEFIEGYLKAVPLSETGTARSKTKMPRALCRTADPIRQHILACLRGEPLCGIDVIARSQRFLEALAGYRE